MKKNLSLLMVFICTLFLYKANAQIKYDDGGILVPNGMQAPSFVVHGNSWNKRIISYYFQNVTSDISATSAKNMVRQAFGIWQAKTHLYFIEACNATDADIVVAWNTGDHGDGYPFDGVGGTLAHGFYPPPNGGSLAGDLHFDDDETWTDQIRNGTLQPLDLLTVAIHEIGHSLGLDHSLVSGSVMEEYYYGSRRTLTADDIAGITSIYGGPVALINGSENVCTQSTYTLNETLPTGYSVSYSVAPAGKVSLVQTGNSVTLTKIANGSITLTATITNGCGSLTSTKSIYVGLTQPPSPTITVSATTNPAKKNINVAFGAPPVGMTYTWQVAKSTGPYPTGAGVNAGSSAFLLINGEFFSYWTYASNACGTSEYTEFAYELQNGVLIPYELARPANPNDNGISNLSKEMGVENTLKLATNKSSIIYPNPVDNVLNIVISKDLIKDDNNITIRIADINGKMILEKTGKANKESTLKIDVSGYVPGTYLISIQTGRSVANEKFIKR
jgi:hypothetical protein